MKIYWNGPSKNIIGSKVKQLRTAQGLSQAALAGKFQFLGMECSDLTILRLEQGSCFVLDYEVAILSEYFNISTDELLGKRGGLVLKG